jgi:predicted transcriptional regulator
MTRTKLHVFMDTTGVTDTELSRESGVSVRHINYIKLGEKEPRRATMAAILEACRRITGKKSVRITDLFDFEEAA